MVNDNQTKPKMSQNSNEMGKTRMVSKDNINIKMAVDFKTTIDFKPRLIDYKLGLILF